MSESDELMESQEEVAVSEDAVESGQPEWEAEIPAEGSVIEGDAVEEPGASPEAEAGGAESEMEGVVPKIDLNTATEEQLQQLPGIGGTLAARIVKYRTESGPFREPNEIMAVSGISDAIYEGIADRLAVETLESAGAEAEPAEEEVAAEAEEPSVPEPEGQEVEEAAGLEAELATTEGEEAVAPEPEPGVVPAPEPEAPGVAAKRPVGPEPPLVEVVPAPVGWGRFLFMGVLSALLGAVLALAFLYAVNGTLDFRTTTIRLVRVEVGRLEGEMAGLSDRLGAVEGRLAAIGELEARLTDAEAGIRRLNGAVEAMQAEMVALTGTMRALRQEFTNLREDVDGLAEHVSMLDNRLAAVEEQLGVLSQEVEAMSEKVQRFDAFLEGLRALLDQIEAGGPEASPSQEGPSGPATVETPTLRPMVTVIPLATPTSAP